MPTGVAIRDPRQQLFDAAERVLLRDGPSGLTSRAVTAEAGVAKGVLHRHFADFDAFLAELARDHIARINAQAATLRERAGTGTVAGNLTGALTELFAPVAAALVSLVIFRDELRTRLRQAGAGQVPVASEATAMIASYLAAEQDLGRIAAGTDIGTLAPTLIGAGHLLSAERKGAPPDAGEVRKIVTAVIAGVEQGPSLAAEVEGDLGDQRLAPGEPNERVRLPADGGTRRDLLRDRLGECHRLILISGAEHDAPPAQDNRAALPAQPPGKPGRLTA